MGQRWYRERETFHKKDVLGEWTDTKRKLPIEILMIKYNNIDTYFTTNS